MRKQALVAVAICGIMGLGLAACVPDVEPKKEGSKNEPVWVAPDWNSLDYDQLVAEMTSLDEAYAPTIVTLEDGRQVQSVPDSENSYLYGSAPTAYNTFYLDGENRGCLSCHTEGLGELLQHMSFPHWNIDNGLGTNIDVTDCLACHKEKMGGLVAGTNQFGQLIHGIHNKDSFKGDCMSCHAANADGKGMQLWDVAKYDAFVGINDVEDVQGEFSFEQDVIKGNDFVWTYWTDPSTTDINAGFPVDSDADLHPDVAEYADWSIAVTGMVDNPREWTLQELIDAAQAAGVIQKTISTQQCEINPANGEWIGTAEVTGIPLMWIMEQSGVQDGARAVIPHGTDGYGPMRGNNFSDLNTLGGWLIYEINGKPLTRLEGFPCRIWAPGHTISHGIRWVNELEAVDHEVNMWDGIGLGERGTGGVGVPWIIDEEKTNGATFYNAPVNAFMGTPDGLVVEAGKPYTFEGYSYGVFDQIVNVEFSCDGGNTWTSFDTSNSDKTKWIYWNFTFTPEDPGAYLLKVRSTTDTGRVTYLPDRVLINAK